MKGSAKSLAALFVLAIAVVMVAGLASGENDEHHAGSGPGCYCHNDGMAIWVNNTDTYAAEDIIYVSVGSGKSFTLLINTLRITAAENLFQPVVAWMPSMTDNARFTFNPQEVKDNSPQDQDPRDGGITALFRITAPNESGSYTISLSAQGPIVSAFVTVKAASPSAFASISNVESPSATGAGAPVGMNVTLRNTGLAPFRLYTYAVDRATGQEVFPKVYSEASVSANGTITLNGVFKMPNGNLTLMIHSGHVEGSRDIDDDLFSVSIFQPRSPPPIHTASIGALAMQWAPWIAIIGASLGSVPVIGIYARKGNGFSSKGEKLKFTIVECAGCSVCKDAIKSLGDGSLNFLSHGVEFASNLASAGEDGGVDVALVVGSIRTEKDIRALKEAREKAKVLVAFGACSAFGELSAGERRRVDAIARGSRSQVPLEELTQRRIETKPLSDYVRVDVVVPGCPPPLETIRYAIDALQYGSSSGEKK